jgi:hypothetical protein
MYPALHVQVVCPVLAVAFPSQGVQLGTLALLMLLPVQSTHAAEPPALAWPGEHGVQLRLMVVFVAVQPDAPKPGWQRAAQPVHERSAVEVPGEVWYCTPAVQSLQPMHIGALYEPSGLKPVAHGPHDPVASE